MSKHQNRGNCYDRTQWNSLEKSFADRWEEENQDTCGTAEILEAIMRPDRKNPELLPNRYPPTPRDRFVAATVIQWLGTNIGFCFLNECLAERGYKIVGGQPNRDHFWPHATDPLLAEMERAQWHDHCDFFSARTQSEVAQALFDYSEPH